MKEIDEIGYKVVNNVFSRNQIREIENEIAYQEMPNKFGVRKFLIGKERLKKLLFTNKVKDLLGEFIPNYFIIRSIYSNKPPMANWIVNWHQDLTINVNEKIQLEGFRNWRSVDDRVVVQPSNEMLDNILTLRIHLDNCNELNGVLRIVPKSHKDGIIEVKSEIKNYTNNSEICPVEAGGIMFMRPLLLHSSRRSENNMNRRVIHIELYNKNLPSGLSWNERINVN